MYQLPIRTSIRSSTTSRGPGARIFQEKASGNRTSSPTLTELLAAAPAFFASLSRTDRHKLLQRLVLARCPDTRQRCLAAIARNRNTLLPDVLFEV